MLDWDLWWTPFIRMNLPIFPKNIIGLCGVVSEIERRYTKKDSKPWRDSHLAKAKDISLPMFPEAYMNFGDRLHEGELAVITGVASVKDGETRLTVDKVESINITCQNYRGIYLVD